MNFYPFMTKWFWAVCIALTFLEAGIWRFRARKYISANPDLAEGYATLIRGFIFWGNIPWIVMGIGCVLGGVPSIQHFSHLRDGNPFVLAFFASLFLIWILGTFWLILRGGAEMLVKHPGLFNPDFKNPLMLKLYWCLGLAVCTVGVIMMFIQELPVPPQ